MLCLGGVCVPYTAVVPLVLLVVRWTLAKLYSWGMVPESIAEMLNLKQIQLQSKCCEDSSSSTTTTASMSKKQSSSSVSTASTTTSSSSTTAVVKELESEEQFEELVATGQIFCMKFTATWCTPCKKIQPKFEQLASSIIGEKNHDDSENDKNPRITFWTVDVDELDMVASKYKVSMMPTFVIAKGNDEVLGTLSGSNEAQLETFLKKHLQ